jgi:hypothetical protein
VRASLFVGELLRGSESHGINLHGIDHSHPQPCTGIHCLSCQNGSMP